MEKYYAAVTVETQFLFFATIYCQAIPGHADVSEMELSTSLIRVIDTAN
jgi:hypothetical protein